MNEEMKETAEIVCEELTDCQKMRGLSFCSGCELQDEYGNCFIGEHIAQALYNAGYHKTIWHKVADGDLPKQKCFILIYYESEVLGKSYTTDLFYMGRFVNYEGQVIAWTELPKYEGEER